jgi:hypothetical protein
MRGVPTGDSRRLDRGGTTSRGARARPENVPNLGERPRRMDPRMIFSGDLSTLYVSVPKTGCTTIKTVVAACVGLLETETVSRGARVQIHRTLRGREERWSDLVDEERNELLVGENTFRFTSVRNPYERIVSCYLNKISDGNADYHLARRLRRNGQVTMRSFLEYVADQPPLQRDVHCRAMVDLCYIGNVNYDDIIRYESFETDIRRVLERLKVGDIPIPRPGGVNRTDAGLHLDELLGVEECALIRTIYQRDFEAFGYSEHHEVNTTSIALAGLVKRTAPDPPRHAPIHASAPSGNSANKPGVFLAACRLRIGAVVRGLDVAKISARLSTRWLLVGLMAIASAICFVVHPAPGVAMGLLAAIAIATTFSTQTEFTKISVIILSAVLFLLEARSVTEDRSAQQSQARAQIQRFLEENKSRA